MAKERSDLCLIKCFNCKRLVDDSTIIWIWDFDLCDDVPVCKDSGPCAEARSEWDPD